MGYLPRPSTPWHTRKCLTRQALLKKEARRVMANITGHKTLIIWNLVMQIASERASERALSR